MSASDVKQPTYRSNPFNAVLDVIAVVGILLGGGLTLSGEKVLLGAWLLGLGSLALVATLAVHAIRHDLEPAITTTPEQQAATEPPAATT